MKKLIFAILLSLNLFAIDNYDFKTYLHKQLYKQEVTANEAFDLKANGAIFIDVRSKNEYDYSHALGAYWIPVFFDKYGTRVFNKKFLDQIAEIISDKNLKIILISKRGDRSKYAANILAENGYKNVYTLKDGFLGKTGWKASGYQYWKNSRYVN